MTVHCAVCRRRFELDRDHVSLEAERVRTDDRNDIDTFYFHPECWRSVSGNWMDPA